MAETGPDESVPLSFRLVMLSIALVLGGTMAEFLFRKIDKGALPHLGIFALDADQHLVLQPDQHARIRRADGEIFEVPALHERR